ncbi:hypothetical protein Dsin_028867 [Dipteronia sinensis]|uniref:Uncharacterized protein n=1 Tax=Dipteronia sinensis TaxID=43782 RepID=A0AAD9ZT16_9ROSI|nr:hypothetical protein Dsin_028867 [Dipteronia sinensis]
MATHRQYQTRDQEYLRKVAAEGFAAVDKFYRRGTPGISPPPPLPPPTPQLYDYREHHRDQYYPQQAAVMNSQEVAQKYGGVLIPDYGMRKQAHVFGGTRIRAPRRAIN